MDILLATINARHAHASLALRCLRANLGEYLPRSEIIEFVNGARIESMAERLLAASPRLVALSIYIWNVDESTRLVAMLKRLAPSLPIVLGGPEVSHETQEQAIVALADHVITGPGETAFHGLCRALLDGPRPLMKIIAGAAPDLDELEPPYPLYSDDDLRHRHLYIEASRGCPFKCEFCLSSLDKTAWPFDTTRLLAQLATLHERGARTFKFIDRTFNLNPRTAAAILAFFLDRTHASPEDPVFAHFELVPDHLPNTLRDAICRFAPGTLQLEIGVQTWNPQVQALISRRQDNERTADNLRWLRSHTHAHLHVDLIAGLPGEDLASFGAGFNHLFGLRPHEIQVGVLKRLRGTPLIRHTDAYDLRFNPAPPYNLLSSDRIAFADMQRISRFSRYWDLIGNSGRFAHSLPLITGDAAFERFMALSDWLYSVTDSTYRIALDRLFDLVGQWLAEPGDIDPMHLAQCLAQDREQARLRRTRPVGAALAAPPRQRRFSQAGAETATEAGAGIAALSARPRA